MKKNIKKILSVGLTLVLATASNGLACLAAETDVFAVNCTSLEDCREKLIQSEAEKRYMELNPLSRVGNWLGEWDKEWNIEEKLTDLIKSDDKVDNTALSLIFSLVKKGAIKIPGVVLGVVAWTWMATFRIPGALWEFLSGYKSDKIHELSTENFKLNVNEKLLNKNNTKLAYDLQKSQTKLEELQKMINLCNKNKTCKVLLNDLLKNGK